MVEQGRQRLSREERRAQLLAVGRRQAEQAGLDGLSTDAVAAEADISRGLLFHYFPTREDFLVAIAEDAAEELLRLTDPDPGLEPLARLQAGLEAYVDYVSANRDLYLALIRGASGGTPQLQEVFDRTRGAQADRILGAVGVGPASAGAGRLRVAARGYVAMVEEATVTWLRDAGELDREGLLELLWETGAALLSIAGAPVDQLG